ncbi:hypothetical protein AALA90_15500 [Lachnospiraceae bacterium 38-10]
MEQLTVAEYAELKGITTRGVRKLICEGKLKASLPFSSGASGRGYQIPLAEIEPKLQKKYMRLHN